MNFAVDVNLLLYASVENQGRASLTTDCATRAA
jgi:hypothetical protein